MRDIAEQVVQVVADQHVVDDERRWEPREHVVNDLPQIRVAVLKRRRRAYNEWKRYVALWEPRTGEISYRLLID